MKPFLLALVFIISLLLATAFVDSMINLHEYKVYETRGDTV